MSVVHARMELAGTAVSCIDDLDVKHKKVIDQMNVEMVRMNERVSEMTVLKEGIEKIYTDLQLPLSPRARRPSSQLGHSPTRKPTRKPTTFTVG